MHYEDFRSWNARSGVLIQTSGTQWMHYEDVVLVRPLLLRPNKGSVGTRFLPAEFYYDEAMSLHVLVACVSTCSLRGAIHKDSTPLAG